MTSQPCSTSKAAATELSSPPLMPTAMRRRGESDSAIRPPPLRATPTAAVVRGHGARRPSVRRPLLLGPRQIALGGRPSRRGSRIRSRSAPASLPLWIRRIRMPSSCKEPSAACRMRSSLRCPRLEGQSGRPACRRSPSPRKGHAGRRAAVEDERAPGKSTSPAALGRCERCRYPGRLLVRAIDAVRASQPAGEPRHGPPILFRRCPRRPPVRRERPRTGPDSPSVSAIHRSTSKVAQARCRRKKFIPPIRR
jgi:hypothetical protein